MARPFASSADLEEKRSTLEELAPGVVAFTAEGDPNVGAVIGEDAVLAVDARATPALAREWLEELRRLTDKPVLYLVLTHYHAVRVLGASAFEAGWVIGGRRDAQLDPRARGSRLRIGDAPLPAPLQGRRIDPRPDVSERGLRGQPDA
jgi:glyoxylase-like metal-dependent hydrolase (beta-lactamase superfamily II)